MKVRVSAAHVTDDGTWRHPGDVLEVERAEGRRLVGEGMAELYGSERNRKDAPGPMSPTTVVGPVSEDVGPVTAPTVKELRAIAHDRGITTAQAKEAWRLEHTGAPSSTVLAPTTADESTDEKE
jgi:aryl-alcohol dehydrogenase-like predicted oxidoreductase